MIRYIFKRILIFLPTLFVISLITFVISINTPGDPVERLLNKSPSGGEGRSSKVADQKAYQKLRRRLGLDLPVFYFSVSNATVSDTLYKVPRRERREILERLAYRYGVWENVAHYYQNLKKLEKALLEIDKDQGNATTLRKANNTIYSLLATHEEKKLESLTDQLDHLFRQNRSLEPARAYFQASRNAFQKMLQDQDIVNRYIPTIKWYGTHNQYHNWIFGDRPWFGKPDPTHYYRSYGFLRGDFGISYFDKRPVSSLLWEAMQWTFLLTATSILITYLLSIPIGVSNALHKGTKKERFSSTALFMLFSLPNFWIGTMLITFFCNPDFYNWFPAAFSLMRLPEDAPVMYKLSQTTYHLILPLFCYTYTSLAYLSRQMRGGMLNVIGQDYIRTARAKGLSERKVIWKHALRNSLIPVITLFGSIFPLLISGSLIIEIIFSIPGMGKISYDALIQRNYPVIYTVMMFTAILTLAGTLVADILYAIVDPRISYSSKNDQ